MANQERLSTGQEISSLADFFWGGEDSCQTEKLAKPTPYPPAPTKPVPTGGDSPRPTP